MQIIKEQICFICTGFFGRNLDSYIHIMFISKLSKKQCYELWYVNRMMSEFCNMQFWICFSVLIKQYLQNRLSSNVLKNQILVGE